MIKIVDGVEIKMTPEEIAEFEAYRASIEMPDSSYTIFKTTVWARMTDDEAETVMAAKNDQPAKFRGMWDDALSIDSGSPYFDTLKGFLASALTAERADELLSPEAV